MNLANFSLDENVFRERLQAFLRTSHSEEVWGILAAGTSEHMIINGLLLVVGFVQLFTILWTWAGIKKIWVVITGKASAGINRGNVTRATPEKIHPLLAACIIIGPDRKHALGLGTFQPTSTYTFEWLAQKANYFANLYSEGSSDPREQPMVALMKDDMYDDYRRRRVPEPFADGKELYLLDILVDPAEVTLTPFPFFAFAVTDPGPDGMIAMLPKAVAEGAIRFHPAGQTAVSQEKRA